MIVATFWKSDFTGDNLGQLSGNPKTIRCKRHWMLVQG